MIIVMLLTISCGSKPIKISDINNNPKKYLNKECYVEVYVTDTFDVPFTSNDYFKINDSTGEIWISTHKGIPPENKKVKVVGLIPWRRCPTKNDIKKY